MYAAGPWFPTVPPFSCSRIYVLKCAAERPNIYIYIGCHLGKLENMCGQMAAQYSFLPRDRKHLEGKFCELCAGHLYICIITDISLAASWLSINR